MRNFDRERENVQAVLNGLNQEYPGWEIVLFDDNPWTESWFCKRPFGIDGMAFYFRCEENESRITNAWIPPFRNALPYSDESIQHDALLNSKLLRFTRTMRTETMIRQLLKIMPEYERLFSIANSNIVKIMEKRERTIETLRSVLPAQYHNLDFNHYRNSAEFDLGSDYEDGKEVRWRELIIRESNGRISEVRISYPDPSIIKQIVELVLEVMLPVQEPEGE